MKKNDVNIWKTVENDFNENKNHLQNMFDNAPIGIYHSSIEGLLYAVNKHLASILGYNSPEELIDMVNKSDGVNHIYVDKNKRVEFVDEVLKDKLWHSFENSYYRKDGSIMDAELSFKAVRDSNNDVKFLEGFIKDITQRKQYEETLLESEKKYRDLTELLPQPIFESDMNGNITFANRIGLEIFGYTHEDLKKGINMSQILKSEDNKMVMEDPDRFNNEKTDSQHLAMKKDGTMIPIMVYSNNIVMGNNIVGTRGVVVDITGLKNAENNIKASLHEKEILLKEIHHRVKNNLQIISSLLNLQTHYVNNDQLAVDVLKESQNRVKSMAMIHEKLYQSKNFSHIQFDDYINRLINDLFYSYATPDEIKPIIDVDNIELNIETSIPCGLIISELISNSLKYAFPNRDNGRIKISLKEHDDRYRLIISDNGVGFPKELDYKNTDSLGLKLINSLVDQIDGEICLNHEHGTEFIITFKELEYKERI